MGRSFAPLGEWGERGKGSEFRTFLGRRALFSHWGGGGCFMPWVVRKGCGRTPPKPRDAMSPGAPSSMTLTVCPHPCPTSPFEGSGDDSPSAASSDFNDTVTQLLLLILPRVHHGSPGVDSGSTLPQLCTRGGGALSYSDTAPVEGH